MSWNKTPKGVIVEYLTEQGVIASAGKDRAKAPADLEAVLADHLTRLPPAARAVAANDLMTRTAAYRKRLGRRFSRKG